MEKTNSNSLVVKGNDLIISRYNLSLAEQRLILQVVSMIKKDDEDFKEYKIKVADYLELVGSESFNYQEIKKFTETLLKKPLYIPRNNGKDFLACNWFSSIEYISGQGVLICCFDPKLKPYLLQLKSCFTSYRLGNILKLKNKYSIRLYEILKRYENMRETKIPLDNFRKYLSIPDTYLYGDIKRQILKPAQKEFKKYTDLIFDFQDIKEFRKVVAIKFMIYLNKSNSNDADDIDITDYINKNQLNYNTPQISQYTQDAKFTQNSSQNKDIDETIDKLLLLIPEDKRTLNLKKYLEKALENYDEKYIKSQIEYVNRQKKVTNYRAYLVKAIEEDYADSEKIKLEEKKEMIKNKYQAQIDRIMSMNINDIPLYISQGKSYYLSSIQFTDNELIIYHDIRDGEIGINSVAPHVIPLDDEEKIELDLRQIERILRSKKENNQETNKSQN